MANPMLKDLGYFQPPELQIRGAAQSRAVGFGKEFAKQYGGTGTFGADAAEQAKRAGRLDYELRLSAATSPLANTMGAAMAMAQAGVLKGNLNKELLDDKLRGAALQKIGNMGPAGFAAELKKQGVDPNVVGAFMNARGANMEQIQKFGIQDVVRGFQGKEVAGVITDELANGMSGSLRNAGLNRRQRRDTAMKAATEMQEAMKGMTQETLNDPAKRNEALAKAITALPGGVDKKALVASAMRNMEEKMKSDPTLARLGGFGNAMAINDPAALKAGGANVGPADRANLEQGQAQGGGGKVLKIAIATLTIKKDGGGEIEGEGGGAAR